MNLGILYFGLKYPFQPENHFRLFDFETWPVWATFLLRIIRRTKKGKATPCYYSWARSVLWDFRYALKQLESCFL